MTRTTIALALVQAFLLGVFATVVAVPWLLEDRSSTFAPYEQVPEEERFVADPAWWPKPPRCPPFSTIVEPTTRPL